MLEYRLENNILFINKNIGTMADNFNLRQFLTENKLTKNTQLLNEAVTLDGKPVDVSSIEIDGIDTSDYPDFVDAYITYAEYEDGTPLTEDELMKLEDENYGLTGELIFDRQLYLEGKEEEKETVKETVKENTMTQRDKYLTRLVENALGLQVTEDDNVDYTMGRQDDPNQLPNPAPELNIPEGEEMVEEKPLPKYENIEKLMQEIDKSTDEEAHKFKMQEMKRVADMLEKKCTGLEEGDDADHIDQKKLKQMKKDIMALRKGIEKMEKVGEKKFTKKETKADLKEGFDLRKFLVENKLTSNSKALNEYEAPTGLVDAAEEFLDNSGMDPQGQLDALEELTRWCTGKIAELEGQDYDDDNYDEYYDGDDRFGEMI